MTVGATAGFDVAVYGGVHTGKVLGRFSLSRTRHIAGLSTSGINTAESEHMLYWTIGGIALKFYRRWANRTARVSPSSISNGL